MKCSLINNWHKVSGPSQKVSAGDDFHRGASKDGECQGNDGQENGKKSFLIYSSDQHSSDKGFRNRRRILLLPRQFKQLNALSLLPFGTMRPCG
jgi:hypothetical protein